MALRRKGFTGRGKGRVDPSGPEKRLRPAPKDGGDCANSLPSGEVDLPATAEDDDDIIADMD